MSGVYNVAEPLLGGNPDGRAIGRPEGVSSVAHPLATLREGDAPRPKIPSGSIDPQFTPLALWIT